MGIFDEVSAKTAGSGLSLFNGNSPLAQIGNAVANQGLQYAKSKMSNDTLAVFNGGLGALDNLRNGDYAGAFEQVLNSGMLNVMAKKVGISLPRTTKSPRTAYLSVEEVQRILMTSHAINQAQKNLWLLSISDYSASSSLRSLGEGISQAVGSYVGKIADSSKIGNLASSATKMLISSTAITSSLNEIGGGITSNFNLLATSVNYTPFSIEADQYNIGSAIADGVKSSQKAEISITTMDDEQGTIKRWFKQKASSIIHKDGTVGVLSEGLVQIRILHGFVSDNTNQGGFEETIICRPVGVEFEFDRREDGMQEFTMRFEQTDTFL